LPGNSFASLQLFQAPGLLTADTRSLHAVALLRNFLSDSVNPVKNVVSIAILAVTDYRDALNGYVGIFLRDAYKWHVGQCRDSGGTMRANSGDGKTYMRIGMSSRCAT